MDDLVSEMQACMICHDLPLGPKPIFKINSKAKILIAGQAPGRITHAKGVPFDDPSGDRLRDWLGVDRDTFYNDPAIAILPMGLCFPGTGKGGDLPPRPECAIAWRGRALAKMPRLELTLIIGRYAIDWHLPEMAKLTVTKAVEMGKNDNQMILPHPSPRNNRWLKQNPWFEVDVLPDLRARIERLRNQSCT
ncbi:Uracil-DNA glycosylase [Rhodobacteraceae bacterium HTCC2150]|nr:Uracil-DNA glycosylase [Rhodobacteraceae bacterium HTCC2150]